MAQRQATSTDTSIKPRFPAHICAKRSNIITNDGAGVSIHRTFEVAFRLSI